MESILPILDEIVSDYAGNNQAYALSLRFSVGQLGTIVTIMACPAVFNIRKTMVDPTWFMFAFVTFGFLMTIVVVAVDSKGQRRVRSR